MGSPILVAGSVVVLALQSVAAAAPGVGPTKPSAQALLDRFDAEQVFWRQLDIAKQIVSLGDKQVLPRLEHWLTDEDRHVRGNAALIFGGLGDPRGIQVIAAMLTDFSDRPPPRGAGPVSSDRRTHVPEPVRDDRQAALLAAAASRFRYQVAEQIREDRYYAVHLLGELKDPRALPLLIPLFADDSVNYGVPWALGEIGGPAAVDALIAALDHRSPDVRVYAIQTLQTCAPGRCGRACARCWRTRKEAIWASCCPSGKRPALRWPHWTRPDGWGADIPEIRDHV